MASLKGETPADIATTYLPELRKNDGYDLNEKRKTTLAEVDKARFSYVQLPVILCFILVTLTSMRCCQLVPCEGRSGRWRRIFHGCVRVSLPAFVEVLRTHGFI